MIGAFAAEEHGGQVCDVFSGAPYPGHARIGVYSLNQAAASSGSVWLTVDG